MCVKSFTTAIQWSLHNAADAIELTDTGKTFALYFLPYLFPNSFYNSFVQERAGGWRGRCIPVQVHERVGLSYRISSCMIWCIFCSLPWWQEEHIKMPLMLDWCRRKISSLGLLVQCQRQMLLSSWHKSCAVRPQLAEIAKEADQSATAARLTEQLVTKILASKEKQVPKVCLPLKPCHSSWPFVCEHARAQQSMPSCHDVQIDWSLMKAHPHTQAHRCPAVKHFNLHDRLLTLAWRACE